MSQDLTGMDLLTQRQLDEFRATFPGLVSEPDGLPLGLHWLIAPTIAPMGELTPDGHAPRQHDVPLETFPRRMWVGGSLTLHAPLALQTRIRRRTSLLPLQSKSGSSGPFCLTGLQHRYEREDGALLLEERQDLAFRGPPTEGAASRPTPEAMPGKAELCWEVPATATLLFRYSAMTFNGHRIHYDLAYARNVERYPNLVVHGPLQATVLLNLAATLLSRSPRTFDYRAVSPLFAGPAFTARGRLGPEGIELSVVSSDNIITMQAKAS